MIMQHFFVVQGHRLHCSSQLLQHNLMYSYLLFLSIRLYGLSNQEGSRNMQGVHCSVLAEL